MMKVLFIRHAKALDVSLVPSGEDMLRPLAPEGRATARRVFAGYSRAVSTPDVVISSEALRAVETARILAEAFGCTSIESSALLNSGCTLAKLRKLLRAMRDRGIETIALVGHEPDFSSLIAGVTACGRLHIDVKKASLVQVDVSDCHEVGTLELLLTPKAVMNLLQRAKRPRTRAK